LRLIKGRYPHAPLLGVGFSAGSNQLRKFLGETGESSPFLCAISVSNAFDLNLCSQQLREKSKIWDRVMTGYMISSFIERHEHLWRAMPELDLGVIKSVRFVHIRHVFE
jgi:predicted alpha/beta-fold hydrolase